MRRNRMFLILLMVSGILSIYIVQLFMLQIIETVYYDESSTVTKAAVHQRARTLTLDDGRAQFVDRHKRPLTGEKVNRVVVFPPLFDHFQGNSANISTQIADILQISPEESARWMSDMPQQPTRWHTLASNEGPLTVTNEQAQQLNALQNPGLLSVPMTVRYTEPYDAAHLIGFVSEHPERVMQLYGADLSAGKMSISSQLGAAGLERTLDPWLRGIGSQTIASYVDGKDRPLRALSVRASKPKSRFYPLHVVLTLDRSIQRSIEQIANQEQMQRGAVVVLEAQTAEIVAMVSRPEYDPNRINMQGQNWRNRAIKAAVPGSIYKTVTAAAALEHGLTTVWEPFMCTGQLGKYQFSCWNKTGHGELTLAEAYAQSCNITFARLAERLTGEQMQTTAQKLGLLDPVGALLHQQTNKADNIALQSILDGEDSGALFTTEAHGQDEGIRVQSAIGQRDVKISPLQAANLVVTLINHGEVKRPQIVNAIEYETGAKLKTFKQETTFAGRSRISHGTAAKIRAWMRDVVTDGTGKELQGLTWNVAGKSGTAQLGHSQARNEWFIGYGPVEAPRYAVAVLVEKQAPFASHEATKIFGKVMNILAET